MKNWYALSNNGDMVALGEHESFDDLEDSIGGNGFVWIASEETAREWLNQLMILLEKLK